MSEYDELDIQNEEDKDAYRSLSYRKIPDLRTEPKELTTTFNCRTLSLAILQDSIHVYLKTSGKSDLRNKHLYEENRAYLWSNRTDWIFSAQNICDLLGFNLDYIRKGVLKLEKAGVKNMNLYALGRETSKGRVCTNDDALDRPGQWRDKNKKKG